MESLRVGDYMYRDPAIIHAETPLSVAVESLLERKQVGAPVVDDDGGLVGFVAEKDCLALLLNNSYHCDLTATVADVMRTNVLTVTPETSIISLAEQVLGNKPKIYPVIEANKVVGVIDLSQLLKAVSTHMKLCFRHAV